ncbi:hypothetical protein N9L06_03845 [Mariniblastus sp.]|nr:hypothetical protein [Mariniblastus sp.]
MLNRKMQQYSLPPHPGLTISYALVSHDSRRGLIDAATTVAQKKSVPFAASGLSSNERRDGSFT